LANLLNSTKNGWKVLPSIKKILLVLLVLFFSLFALERYGVNVAKYHTPVPDCIQVLSYDKCKSYGPWIRDYNFSKNKVTGVDTSPVAYTTRWTYGMWLRNFYSIGGKQSDYQSRGPLYWPSISSAIFVVLGTLSLIVCFKK
jgi:hypothetical protein